ncbi:MAG: ATP-binding protein [Anaerolineae bacterium]
MKYHVEINQAQGIVIGDHAHVEQHLYTAPPPSIPASRDELLAAICQTGAELRSYPNDIAGIHIERSEVAQIVDWALKAEPNERLGMLLDQPGGGKTVVMRDVLEHLEAADVPVLAIKADTLSGIKTRADLADRLGLPALVEECARHLATEGPFVVVLDQLDALSLALSRDQTTLDMMLSTLARLRDINGVRIVASCRTFDLNNDPRLSTIKVDRKFQLQPLDDSQVNQVLQAIGIDPARLLPAHRVLLRVPLHLSVYAQVVAGDTPKHSSESFRTLQELYEALWRKRIDTAPPDTPAPAERIAAIYRLVEAMQGSRQLTVPVGVLDEHPEVANYLERVGFIRRERGNWLFFHQTLFDYCYARRFVAQGKSLSQEILGGPQGLFERSQMVQVLAYLRGVNEAEYRRGLTNLLFADGLRVHLRLLLIGWFGSLPSVTADELRIARRLMRDADDRARFLQAAGGNEDWFEMLNNEVLPPLLHADDRELDRVVIPYLSTLIQRRTDAVLTHLCPYLGQSEARDAHIAFCLSRMDNWQSDQALDVLCDLLHRGRAAGWERSCLHNLAKSNPAAGCRALRAYLDYRLDDLLAQSERSDRFSWNQKLLGEHAIGRVMEPAVQGCPDEVIAHLLPWFVRAVVVLTEPHDRDDYYPSDPIFAWSWYGEHISEGAVFAIRIAEALQHSAHTQPANFRAIATELAAIESLAVQRVLAQAYLADPETYADDIFEYLVADRRRLNLGDLEDSHYDSYRLYDAAFRHVDVEHRAFLEQLILGWQPTWEQRSLRHRGLTQLRFLKSVTPDLLSETARRRLQELERKFPNLELHPPQGIQFGGVGPPIEQAAQAKMSDEAWLGAMRKYDDSTAWDAPREDPLKGGVVELSRSFAEQVKQDPERFCRLAQCFDETISLYYVAAAISGLADSDAPAEWVFNLARQFALRIEGEFRRGVCRALEKRGEAGVSDDLLDVMTDWGLHDPDPTEEAWRILADSGEPYYGGDPHSHGINTNRGAAVRAICRCALARRPPQVERVFCLLEQAAEDPSTAVRACVVESLGPLLNEDANRALTVFESTLDGHPRLLQSPLLHRFLHCTYYHHFTRIRPFIESLLTDINDATRQAGASLTCLAAFRYLEANELAERAVHGDVAMRRGAARVYARNLEYPHLEAVCKQHLVQLMHDPDEQVRAHVGECFRYLHPEHLDHLRSFIEEFLASPALMNGGEHLVEYLAPLALDVPDLALVVTECILDAAGSDVTDMRTTWSILERDLVRLPLTVYTHAFDPVEKSRAMDLFERLLLLGSRAAHQALTDWDRR